MNGLIEDEERNNNETKLTYLMSIFIFNVYVLTRYINIIKKKQLFEIITYD